ncbi:hydroxymyristoyl-ACP dehydratase [Xenorhabdus kozodoii]|uniref:Hydroxymyristoyl-ACP dehydratase n=1 Tax=Xenorhabdus kozodoii TaxID=351676 RepID=A0A2D0L2A6_9GAMM|nr:hydroxymyristoyl-ACP dehydratase [Xenorhabdus kozodoii]
MQPIEIHREQPAQNEAIITLYLYAINLKMQELKSGNYLSTGWSIPVLFRVM